MRGIGVDALTGTIPSLSFVAFQLTFAGLSVALISGAIIGRMKFNALIAFIIVWLSLVYIPISLGMGRWMAYELRSS